MIEQPEAGSALQIVDVREPNEFVAGHLTGALNIPLGMLAQRLGDWPRDASVVFVCRSGARSGRAADLAAQAGVRAIGHLEGGLLAWAASCDPSLRVA
jgi:rhodanese-related sulfurtransferase